MTIYGITKQRIPSQTSRVSMFPIIPHHLLKTSNGESSLAFSSDSAFPKMPISFSDSVSPPPKHNECASKVTSISNLTANTVSDVFQVQQMCVINSSSNSEHVQVRLSDDGKLRACDKEESAASWIKKIRLADDCHSYNVLLRTERYGSRDLLLEVVRPVRSGEELLLWFSEQLLALLSMPFLAPANIQGEKHYVCHICGRQFEIPNPLKVHIALQCGRLRLSQLWKRLDKQFHSLTPSRTEICTQVLPQAANSFPFKFELKTSTSFTVKDGETHSQNNEQNDSGERNEVKTSLPTSLGTRSISDSINARNSAFKPYWRRSNVTTVDRTTQISPKKQKVQEDTGNASMPSNHVTPSSAETDKFFRLQPPMATTSQTQRLFHQVDPSGMVMIAQSHSHIAFNTTNFNHHAAEMETLVSNLGKSKQGHLCIYCGKIYSRKYGLKIHIRTHTGYKPLKCKYCLRPFGDPSNLNKHVRLHAEGETPYKCDLCGKILVRRRDLERHIKSRHYTEHGVRGTPTTIDENHDQIKITK